jgi:hypothetical protein
MFPAPAFSSTLCRATVQTAARDPLNNDAMRTIEWSLAEHNYRAGFERWAIPGCRTVLCIRA